MTGPGFAQRWSHPSGVLLFNFNIDSATPKLEHQDALRQMVVPHLKSGRVGVSLVGLTSRSGTDAHNHWLSEQRAKRTLDFLRSQVQSDFACREVVGFGELKAAAEGYRDGTEDPRFRAVLVVYAPGSTPPPPPTLVDLNSVKLPKKLLPGIDWADTIQWSLDRFNDFTSLFDLLPWETIAEFGGRLNFWGTIVSGTLQMPLLWTSVREQNHTNGRLQGFWEAMQDMSRPFNNSSLRTMPLSDWPALPIPTPRSSDLHLSIVNEREWMEGRRNGCKEAYGMISAMDRKPVDLEDKNQDTVSMTGRQLLANLALNYGGQVGEHVKKYFETKIKKTLPLMGN